jgi:hypothetical protein
LIIIENKNNSKVKRKVFLIIKNGPGFMGSLMHSLIKDMDDIGSYNGHKRLQQSSHSDEIIWASCPNMEKFWLFISLILHQDGNLI